MQKLLFFLFIGGAFAFGSSPNSIEGKNETEPWLVQYEAPTGWSCQAVPGILRCPAPSSWTDANGWMMVLLKKGDGLAVGLELPAGRVNEVLVDEARQLAVVSAQIDRATFVIYVVSLKEGKVWAADTKIIGNVLAERKPKEDPRNRFALSPFQLVGLYQEDSRVKGVVRHMSALNSQDHGLSMIIRFSIDLSAPPPAVGKPWPISSLNVEDSVKEREWIPGKKDFNPPFVTPKEG